MCGVLSSEQWDLLCSMELAGAGVGVEGCREVFNHGFTSGDQTRFSKNAGACFLQGVASVLRQL